MVPILVKTMREPLRRKTAREISTKGNRAIYSSSDSKIKVFYEKSNNLSLFNNIWRHTFLISSNYHYDNGHSNTTTTFFSEVGQVDVYFD